MSNILDHILDKFKIYLHILHFQFSVFLVKSRDQHLTQKRIGAGSTRSLKKRGLWLREVADEEREGQGEHGSVGELIDVGQILMRMLIGNLQWRNMTKNLFIVKQGHRKV